MPKDLEVAKVVIDLATHMWMNVSRYTSPLREDAGKSEEEISHHRTEKEVSFEASGVVIVD